jgi:hypothetical protein
MWQMKNKYMFLHITKIASYMFRIQCFKKWGNAAVGDMAARNGGKVEKMEGNPSCVTDSLVPRRFRLDQAVVGAPRRPGFGLRSPDVI